MRIEIDSATPRSGRVRQRAKQAAMVEIQEVALDLFEEHGYTDVTVSAIADAAQVGAATIYRYFGTKSGIVFWSSHLDALPESVRANANSMPPLDAVCAAILSTVAPGYEDPHGRRLISAVYSSPDLSAGVMDAERELMRVIGATLRDAYSVSSDVEIETIVRTTSVLTNLALAHWCRDAFETPLVDHIESAFNAARSVWSPIGTEEVAAELCL